MNSRALHNMSRKTRILIAIIFLLLLAVLGLLVNQTNAKFVAGLHDYTSAVAGDFFFTSDYLTEDFQVYHVPTWEGKELSFQVNIRGFENSLRHNGEGTDVFYYVSPAIYKDKAMTVIDPDYIITVSYDRQTDDTTEDASVGTYVYEINGESGENKVGYIPGLESFSRVAESNVVTVEVSLRDGKTVPADTIRYLRLEAVVIPLNELDEDHIDLYDSYQEEFDEGTFTFPTKGVYSIHLGCIMSLGTNATDAEIDTEVIEAREGYYSFRYAVKCDGLASGANSQTVRIYFLDSDFLLDSASQVTGTASTTHSGWTYVDVVVNKQGKTDISLFKTRDDIVIGDGGLLDKEDTPEDGINVYTVLIETLGEAE